MQIGSCALGGLENVSVHCEMERRPCRNSSDHLRAPYTNSAID